MSWSKYSQEYTYSDHGTSSLRDTEYHDMDARVSRASKHQICQSCGVNVTAKKWPKKWLYGRFALMANCSCVLCMGCVKFHRKPYRCHVDKACPVCKTESPYYAGSITWLPEGPQKLERLNSYLEYVRSRLCGFEKAGGYCGLGSECMYKHENIPNTSEEEEEEASSEYYDEDEAKWC